MSPPPSPRYKCIEPARWPRAIMALAAYGDCFTGWPLGTGTEKRKPVATILREVLRHPITRERSGGRRDLRRTIPDTKWFVLSHGLLPRRIGVDRFPKNWMTRLRSRPRYGRS